MIFLDWTNRRNWPILGILLCLAATRRRREKKRSDKLSHFNWTCEQFFIIKTTTNIEGENREGSVWIAFQLPVPAVILFPHATWASAHCRCFEPLLRWLEHLVAHVKHPIGINTGAWFLYKKRGWGLTFIPVTKADPHEKRFLDFTILLQQKCDVNAYPIHFFFKRWKVFKNIYKYRSVIKRRETMEKLRAFSD